LIFLISFQHFSSHKQTNLSLNHNLQTSFSLLFFFFSLVVLVRWDVHRDSTICKYERNAGWTAGVINKKPFDIFLKMLKGLIYLRLVESVDRVDGRRDTHPLSNFNQRRDGRFGFNTFSSSFLTLRALILGLSQSKSQTPTNRPSADTTIFFTFIYQTIKQQHKKKTFII